MHTEKIPRNKSEKAEYLRSESMRVLKLPDVEPLRSQSLILKEALVTDEQKTVQKACKAIIDTLSIAYEVEKPSVRVLSARPLEEGKNWVFELFGDYDPEKVRIRLWMRTAVQKKATSYGTFLSTLCHEFCHHLDVVSLELPNTFHTRGFYERTALLYHHLQNTPVRPIVWQQQKNGTYLVDWARTMNSTPGR